LIPGRVRGTFIAVPLVLKSLTVGWPPQATFEPTRGEEEPLNDLFVFLEDKRLLTRGYGIRGGITDLDTLRARVDDIRDRLYTALTALRPRAPIAEWLRKLQEACGEIIDAANEVVWESDKAAAEPSDFAPAVDQLREAFRVVAAHVWALYRLPAAGNLADQIRRDIGSALT
jgi:hypothetical protein